MKYLISLSRWSKLNYVLGSIAATVRGRKIRPTDALYGSGSTSCYAHVSQKLKELDPCMSSGMRILCFAQPGVDDEPQHCILTDAHYRVLANTWGNDFIRTDGRISGYRVGPDDERIVVYDMPVSVFALTYAHA